MVVGLSMAGRSGDHLPLPQSDLEAGSSLPGEEGDCCAAGKHTQAGCTNDLQDGQQIPATSAAKAEWYAYPDQGEFASSKATLACGDTCALLDSDGEDNVDMVERGRVRRKLSWAIVLCCLFMGIEVFGGLVSNSLAILTDAAHLLSDVAGFAISLFALWAVSWRATRRHSFGYQRVEILGALASILMTWLITAFIVFEAVNRLLYSSEEVNGRVMFLTAAFGVVVNVAMAVLLFEHHSHGLPGAACRGHAHAHGEKHSHTLRPAPVKAKVSGYGTLEQAEEVPSAKDTCLEAGRVELAAGESVAVVVHCHDDGQPPGSKDSHPHEGDHQDSRAPHAEAAQTGQNDAGVKRGALSHVHGPDESNVRHDPPSAHPGQAAPSAVSPGDPRSCTAGGKASRAHCHPPQDQRHAGGATLHPPRHAHPHSHSCAHSKGPQRAVPSHPTVPAVKLPGQGPELPSPDPFTALFSPLQLFSEAPTFPSPKLDSGSPAKEDMAGWHGHAEGECEGGHQHRKQNINLRGAFVHVLGDLVQSVGVMVAGAIIWVKPEWRAVDLACTFLFSTLVIGTTVKILRDILEILMECTPREIDAAEVEAALLQLDGVQGLHELHIWAVSVGKNVLTCHVAAKQGADIKRILQEASSLCNQRFRIEHVTIQVEC